MTDCRICELCGKPADHRHHVFGGCNRKLSEKYGLVADLCHLCHINSNYAVHRNRFSDLKLKRKYQRMFEERYPEESFIKIFGRNYL